MEMNTAECGRSRFMLHGVINTLKFATNTDVIGSDIALADLGEKHENPLQTHISQERAPDCGQSRFAFHNAISMGETATKLCITETSGHCGQNMRERAMNLHVKGTATTGHVPWCHGVINTGELVANTFVTQVLQIALFA